MSGQDNTEPINKIIDKIKDSNRKTTNVAIRSVSNNMQTVNDYHDQSLQAMADITTTIIESQKQFFEIFKPAWLQYGEKLYEVMPQLKIMAKIYEEGASLVRDNITSSVKLANKIACADMEAYKVALNQAKSNANVLISNCPPILITVPSQNKVAEDILQRYPSARFPKKMALEDIAGLEVSIKTLQAGSVEPKSVTSNELDPNYIPIDVIINQGTFELIGENYARIFVPTKTEDSKPVVFNLRAKEKGLQDIEVKYLQNGTYLGKLKVSTVVVSDSTEHTDDSQVQQTELVNGQWRFPVIRPDPDVTLYIYEKNRHEFEYGVLYSSIKVPFKFVGPIKFEQDPDPKFRAIFQDFENSNLPANYVDDFIQSKGESLYNDLFPQDLKDLYWQMRDEIKSIRVISQEPWIPWEIVKPWRRVNGRKEKDKFLCEQYSFSRWVEQSEDIKDNQLKRIKVIVPSDTDLDIAKQERDWIIQFGVARGLDVSSISTYTDVKAALENGDFDILHFSTHGQFNEKNPGSSAIELEGKIPLTADSIIGATLTKTNPLVFLNACQTGAQGFSLTGTVSWAKNFIEAGAGSFIGPLWSVSEESAIRFVKEFYKQLATGTTLLGDAVRNARNYSKQEGDPSWLAYQFYGHPNSKIKLG